MTFLLSLLSALLLIISFPRMEIWQLAWVALVPLCFALEGKTYRQSFVRGLLFGFIFFFGTLGWLVYVTYPGAVLLCLYLALYPAFFAFGFKYFQKLSLIPRVVVLASWWAGLELLRATLFTGFGWCTLGHSQYKNLLLIQVADIIGHYGISFLVILVNLVVFETLRAVFKKQTSIFGQLRLLQVGSLLVLIGCFAYGLWVFKTMQFPSVVKVAVVQPNIAQEIKWDGRYMPSIVKKTLDLTDQVKTHHPDMILWPETSLPGVASEEPAFVQQIQLKAMDLKIPIIMGAITQDNDLYYNSAIMIAANGAIQGHYHKIHLVPFGEFLPLRPLLWWLNRYIGLEDFSSGKEYKLFSAGPGTHKFGMLICFEDTIGYLWRNFAKQGAGFLMNMTNDAWFMDTKEPYIHLQGAVLECVQNKRSLVRAANTGVSGFVDPLGRILGLAHDKAGKETFVEAVASADVPVNNTLTFYTKFPSFFTSLCFVCILGGIWAAKRQGEQHA